MPTLVLLGCGDDGGSSSTNRDKSCGEGETYEAATDSCVSSYVPSDNPGTGADSSPPDGGLESPGDDDPEPEVDAGGMSEPDGGSLYITNDAGETINCNKDRDNSRAEACGGTDCDDNDRSRGGNRYEVCDDIDHDCDGKPRGGITCSFFAHEAKNLYRVNPFEKKAEKVRGQLPGLHDLDTHPNGALYGVTPDGIYVYEPSLPNGSAGPGSEGSQCSTPDDVSEEWKRITCFSDSSSSDTPEFPQGLAIDRVDRPNRKGEGEGATMFVVSENQLYTVLKRESETYNWVQATSEKMGNDSDNGEPYRASGDCVTRKRSLYMTSKHPPEKYDYLVTLDPRTGEASEPLSIEGENGDGYSNVFGLTQAWGTLYGLTEAGELITIDPETGRAELVTTFEERRWFGAASTPGRR